MSSVQNVCLNWSPDVTLHHGLVECLSEKERYYQVQDVDQTSLEDPKALMSILSSQKFGFLICLRLFLLFLQLKGTNLQLSRELILRKGLAIADLSEI